VQEIDRG
jgi:hypothetical protein